MRDPRSTPKNPSVSLRVLRGCLLCLLLGALAADVTAAELKIVRVFSGWRDAAAFKRISEYFDGQENTGGQLVLRTHPEQRTGYYFLVRLANHSAAVATKIELELITPTSAKPVTYTFSATLNSGDSVLNLGLTGPDWPDKKSNPVAWKIVVRAADGSQLTSDSSYLWEKPAQE